MENRINVAKLLKNCPSGMELNCTLYYNVFFDRICENDDCLYPIKCYTIEDGIRNSVDFTEFGEFHTIIKSKCVIFPKGKTTWEGFVPPCKFKDGDVVAHQNHIGTWIGIYHKHDYLNETFSSYCCIGRDGKFWADFNNDHGYDKTRLATEEEKQKLFKAIKDNGYKWNPETKELEKLIQPKFKVGDWVVNKFGDVWHIDSFNSENYQVSNGDKYCYFLIEEQDKMHLWTINDAKDGDVIFYDSGWTCIFKRIHGIWYSSYCFITSDGEFHPGYNEHAVDAKINGNAHPATEDQCRFLFRKIKEAGYKWNTYTKTLEEPIKPKFKVGDKIRGKYTHNIYTISCITPTEYNLTNGQSFTFDDEDCYELAPDKFDITTLKPFAEVLVRNTNNGRWCGQLYMSYNENEEYPFECVYNCWKQCIPYEGNEHLFNKTDDCTNYFKTWE